MLQDGELIEPCACKGTQRYVHKRCLVRWQATFFSIRRSPPFSSSPAYPREREREREREIVGECVCVSADVVRSLGDSVILFSPSLSLPLSHLSFSHPPPLSVGLSLSVFLQQVTQAQPNSLRALICSVCTEPFSIRPPPVTPGRHCLCHFFLVHAAALVCFPTSYGAQYLTSVSVSVKRDLNLVSKET